MRDEKLLNENVIRLDISCNTVEKLKENKIYRLLKTNTIYNKKIGNNYIIPKISVIEYLMNN